MSIDSVLTLTAVGLVPFATRGVTESLRPIDQGKLARTVNGVLVDLTLPQHRKYAVSLQFGDVLPVALDGIWRGMAVTIGCITALGAKVTLTAGVGSVQLGRTPVAGSGQAIWRSSDGATVHETTAVAFAVPTGDTATVATANFADAALTGEAFVFYRPTLSCLVTGFGSDFDEWAAKPGATLEIEEV